MTLLQVIKNASINPEAVASQADYPFVLNANAILPHLKAKHENRDLTSLVCAVKGWELKESDALGIDSAKKFYAKLRRKLKDTNKFNKDEFLEILTQFLLKSCTRAGISVTIDSSDDSYSCVLVERGQLLMGQDVLGLVLEACVKFETWDLIKTLIVSGVLEKSCYSFLVTSLTEKKISDLLCLCIKHAPDLGLSELLSILKYFLSPSKDSYATMTNVRKEWQNQALLAITKASDTNLRGKVLLMAKEASVLLMVAYDGFTTSELCLHYLLASANIDEVMLSSAVSKLNGRELMNLIRYLGKWLMKFEKFPQAIPCPEASITFGLKACDWVPKIETVANFLGLVIDENFSCIALYPEFHEELKSMENVIRCLSLEAKFCCLIGNVVDTLRSEAKGDQF